jgi:microcompartment protein CcmK/EutM
MVLCKVLGPVVATEKHPAFARLKLLVVQPVDEKGAPAGRSFLAVDRAVQAGEGDTVLVLREGTGIRQLFGIPLTGKLPIRSCIVGIVDAAVAG